MNDEHLSPELALVDAELAVDARSALPADDTLARIELLVRAHRIIESRAPARVEVPAPPREEPPAPATAAPLPAPAAFAPAPAAPAPAAPLAPAPAPSAPALTEPVSEPAPVARRGLSGPRRSTVVAGSLAAAALVSATLVGVRIDLGGQSAGADSSSIGEPPVVPPRAATSPRTPASTSKHTRPAIRPHRSSPPPAAKPRVTAQPRRFVWAPVARASSYRVQFFRGSKLVFEARTQKAEVTVPTSWTIAGVRRSLTPGTYRWNVWPITKNGQQSKAVVQAEVHVSD